MRVIENADRLVISQQQPADKEKPVANQPYRHDSQSDFLHSPARQQKQYHAGKDGEQQPHTEVSLQPPPRDIETVEQRGECRTEQPVAQEIGGQIHQYGGIDIHESDTEKEMRRIVGCKQQHRCPHNPPGTQVIIENDFLRRLGKKKIKAEEQHQRQGDTKRVTVYRIIHAVSTPYDAVGVYEVCPPAHCRAAVRLAEDVNFPLSICRLKDLHRFPNIY